MSISDPAAWEELWSHLYHQGGVGEIAYAVVPELVRIYQFSRALEWNAYALVATVDLARDADRNPPLPDRVAPEYSLAISALANLGRRQIESAASLTEVRSILAILALHKGARLQAHFLLDYEPDELVDMDRSGRTRVDPNQRRAEAQKGATFDVHTPLLVCMHGA